MTGLKQRARTVQDALAAGGFECHVVELPSSTPNAVFRIEPGQLVQLTGGKVLDIS
jgi:hypothetical protein